VSRPIPGTLPDGIGCCVLERPLLNTLERLWEGPLSPADLPRIEKSLRAMMVGQTLVVSRVHDPWAMVDMRAGPERGSLAESEAFGDHLLDYEFIAPTEPHPHFAIVDGREGAFLERTVLDSIRAEALASVPKWVSRTGQFYAFLDAWYMGGKVSQSDVAHRENARYSDEEYRKPFEPDDCGGHTVFHRGPAEHAAYLVGCHRAGASVFGDSPVARHCATHVFSKWPEELFRTLDENYETVAAQLRGPGIAVIVPPILAILLSRTHSREQIPATIRELRDEYEKGRRELWEIMVEMWSAPLVKGQIKVLRRLEGASRSLFAASFPEAIDVLSLGVSLAPLSLGGVGNAARILLDREKPKSRVAAVGFAEKLAGDIRKMGNARSILRRHLTDAELEDFGF
jgi:hypothetical protein